MRILIVSATYVPSANGVAITAAQQKTGLESLGHEVVVIAPHHPKEVREKNVIRIPSATNLFDLDYPIPLPLGNLADEVRKIFKPDLVHFHHPFYIGKLALKLAREFNVPAVFFYHTQYRKYFSKFLPNLTLLKDLPDLVDRHVSEIISKSDAVVVETKSVEKDLKDQGISREIEVIPTGRKFLKSSQDSKRVLRRKYGIPDNAIVVLTVSRLSKEKNLTSLLDIFRRLKTLKPVYLVLVGDGPDKAKLKTYVRDRNIKRVLFLGTIPFGSINEVYQLADVFAHSALTDTQAVVLVEAMNFGLPLIGFSAPGPIDFIWPKRNGFIAENQEDYLNGLTQLMENPGLRTKMGKESYMRAKKFTFEKTIDALEKLFNSLINKHGGISSGNRMAVVELLQ